MPASKRDQLLATSVGQVIGSPLAGWSAPQATPSPSCSSPPWGLAVAGLEVRVEIGEHWKAKESKVFQLYEFAKANLKKDATPNLGENEKFGG